jgi:hypothetical protein
MRYFAGDHPDEVAGIVYVEPGRIVTQSVAQEHGSGSKSPGRRRPTMACCAGGNRTG